MNGLGTRSLLSAAALCVLVVTGCSSESNGTEDATDVTAPDADASDVGEVSDAMSNDADADGSGAECAGACQETSVAMFVNSIELEAERAVYGLLAPHNTSTGEWALHVGIDRGGSPDCPFDGTPPTGDGPEQSIAINYLPLGDVGETFTSADDGVALDLWDSGGGFGQAQGYTATSVSLTVVAADVCLDCSASDPDSYLAFDLEAAFPGGTVSGHVFARHCPFLDSL